MRRSLLLLAALCAAACAQNRKVEFNLAPREVVEQRLGRAPARETEREAVLRGIFEEAGCNAGMLTEQKVGGFGQPNLICTAAGETGSVILVGAHFDSVNQGRGIVDNWTGASLLPSLFQALRDKPRRHTFMFVGFTAEEVGLRGSRSYVRQLTKEQRAAIKAMVNIDSLGLSPTKVWLSASDKKLAGLIAAVAKSMRLPLSGMDVDQVGTSDSQSFKDQKIPSITFHSVTQDTLSILHSPRDNLQAVRLDDYDQSYRLIAGYLALLDQVLE